MKRLPILISIALILSSCMNSLPEEPESPLVVEGWIESGSNPMVFVTKLITTSTETFSTDNLQEMILRYAKVSIEHNGEIYPLTANLSDDYYIQNYYTTSKLFGEVGETYTLKVEYNGIVATSTTTIPAPAEIYKFDVEESVFESKYTIKVHFHNKPQTKNYYKLSVWIENKDKYYTAGYMGFINGEIVGEDVAWHIEKGSHLPDLDTDYYFEKGDIVKIKFATMNEDSYTFWSNFNQTSLLVTFPFNISAPDCTGNVTGALGYWDGYGKTEYTICVE